MQTKLKQAISLLFPLAIKLTSSYRCFLKASLHPEEPQQMRMTEGAPMIHTGNQETQRSDPGEASNEQRSFKSQVKACLSRPFSYRILDRCPGNSFYQPPSSERRQFIVYALTPTKQLYE